MNKRIKTISITLALAVTSIASNAHQGHVHELASNACVNKERSQACEYTVGKNSLYRGACQYMQQHLICVRNKPIVKQFHELKPEKTEEQTEEESTHTSPTK